MVVFIMMAIQVRIWRGDMLFCQLLRKADSFLSFIKQHSKEKGDLSMIPEESLSSTTSPSSTGASSSYLLQCFLLFHPIQATSYHTNLIFHRFSLFCMRSITSESKIRSEVVQKKEQNTDPHGDLTIMFRTPRKEMKRIIKSLLLLLFYKKGELFVWKRE